MFGDDSTPLGPDFHQGSGVGQNVFGNGYAFDPSLAALAAHPTVLPIIDELCGHSPQLRYDLTHLFTHFPRPPFPGGFPWFFADFRWASVR